MFIQDAISTKQSDFKKACSSHQVKYLYAFGSSVTNEFDYEKSDVDLLVEIEDNDPMVRGEMLLLLWDTFELFFHRNMDLLTESSIRNPYLRKSIDSTKVLIYDGTRQEVFV